MAENSKSISILPLRRNVSKIAKNARDKFRDAFVKLNTGEFKFPGYRDYKPFPGGVTYWFKQDEIHQATHVHGGPAFLPWHRELCNRFEKLLRLAESSVSLHYWDWNEDPEHTTDDENKPLNLFTNEFMGHAKNKDGTPILAGEPWSSAKFYNPNPTNENYRSIYEFDKLHNNPADPPIEISRQKKDGTLKEWAKEIEQPFFSDEEILRSATFPEMRRRLEHIHNLAHVYIGGTIGNSHTAFRDPFVFLIHSNVDRLFAAWQLQHGNEWRLDPKYIYGSETNSTAVGTPPEMTVGIMTLLSPWCGMDQLNSEPGLKDVRPWASPDNWHKLPELYPYERDNIKKNSLHTTVVMPPKYDDMNDENGNLKKESINFCGSSKDLDKLLEDHHHND